MAKKRQQYLQAQGRSVRGRVPVGYRDNGKIKYKSVYARTLSEVKEDGGGVLH